MKKKMFVLLLSLTLAMGLMPGLTFADEEEETTVVASGETFTDCVWTLDSDGVLTLSSAEGATGSLGTGMSAGWSSYSTQITSFIVADEITAEGAVLASFFFYYHSLEYVDLSNLVVSDLTDLSNMFYCCSELETVDGITDWDTSAVTTTAYMFLSCSSLENVDLSGWELSAATSMRGMFKNCNELVSVGDVSGWNLSSVTDMRYVFYNCYALSELNVSDWDLSSVSWAEQMFYSCESLTSLDTSGWNLSSNNSFEEMFYGCSSLETVDASGWNVSCHYLARTFYGCSSLKTLDLSAWDTSEALELTAMFSGCTSLEYLNLSGWDTSSVTDAANLFYKCTALRTVVLGENFVFYQYGYLPLPVDSELGTGYWVDDSGNIYTSAYSIPSNTAAVYTADFYADTDDDESSEYSYEMSVINPYCELYTYTGSSNTYMAIDTLVYVKTDNPDPAVLTFSSAQGTTTAKFLYSMFEDLDPEGTYSSGSKGWVTVDGGYIFALRNSKAGEVTVELYESGVSTGVTVTYTVSDYSEAYDAWADDIIEQTGLDDDMTGYEMMKAIARYFLNNYTYYTNDGSSLRFLYATYGTHWQNHEVDSVTGPQILAYVGQKLGLDVEIYTTNSSLASHAYIKYTDEDGESHAILATPQTNTGTVNDREVVMLSMDEVNTTDGNHVWDEGTVTKEAAFSESGTVLYTCTKCGETYEDTVPAAGNGLIYDSETGIWTYYTDGEVDTTYTGLAKNDYGWWYVNAGYLDLTYTGMAKNSYGWWYVTDGSLDLTYTGMAKNAYGWWYMTDGKLDLTYTGMAKNAYGWWYMTDSKLDLTYTGMAKNAYGWWYMTDGKLDLTYTGMAKNAYGWWYMTNGQLDTSYTGLATNDYGTWYMVNGKLTYYTGTVTVDGVAYTVKNGMVVS